MKIIVHAKNIIIQKDKTFANNYVLFLFVLKTIKLNKIRPPPRDLL